MVLFLSIRHIIEPGIFNPIGKSLFNFKPIDLLFLLDFVILFLVYKFTGLKNVKYKSSLKTRLIAFISVFGISAIVIGFGHYYLDIAKKSDKVLFRIAWAPFQTFSDISPLGYHGYDIYYYTNKEMTLTDAEKMKLKLGLMKIKKIYQIISIRECLKEKKSYSYSGRIT